MSKIVCLLIVLVAIIESSRALKCHQCSNECEKTIEEQCTTSGDQKVACVKHVYKDKSNKKMTDKKCVLYMKDVEKYACQNVPGNTELSCDTCTTDLCNSATSPALGAMALVGTVIAFFVPTFF